MMMLDWNYSNSLVRSVWIFDGQEADSQFLCNWKQQMPSTQMEHPQHSQLNSVCSTSSQSGKHTHARLHVFLHRPAAKQKYILKCTCLFFPAGRRLTVCHGLDTHSLSSMSHGKPDCHYNNATNWPEVSADAFWHSLFHTTFTQRTHIHSSGLAHSTCDSQTVDQQRSGWALQRQRIPPAPIYLSHTYTDSWRFRRGYEYHCKVLAWLILT